MNPKTAARRACALLIPLSLALMQACGNVEGESDTTELTISLTDAAGDFNQYTIDVDSIKLYRANGAIVETLPNTTRLDFTQYVEVSEFLTTVTVPAGRYDKAEIALDFDNAEITVEDEFGNSLPATAEDADGNPAGELVATIVINAEQGFNLLPGAPAALVLDFDLEASNEVVFHANGATVTVNPVLIASTGFDTDKTRRLRGLLAGVNLAEESFAIRVRPFRVRHRDYGRITAHTDVDSLFEIDGVVYRQQEGAGSIPE